MRRTRTLTGLVALLALVSASMAGFGLVGLAAYSSGGGEAVYAPPLGAPLNRFSVPPYRFIHGGGGVVGVEGSAVGVCLVAAPPGSVLSATLSPAGRGGRLVGVEVYVGGGLAGSAVVYAPGPTVVDLVKFRG